MIRTRKRKVRPDTYRKPGRKGVYDSTTPERAIWLMARGLTEKDLAVAFGVNVTTIERWQRDLPEFSEAMQKGKKQADENVVKSLYKSAMGYSHRDIKIVSTKDGVLTIPILKHYPPDVTACIFWLKNRQREDWADVQKFESTANMNINVNGKLDLSILSGEEQRLIKSIAIKRLKSIEGVRHN